MEHLQESVDCRISCSLLVCADALLEPELLHFVVVVVLLLAVRLTS